MTSSAAKGDNLEDKVFEFFRREIEENRFYVRQENCKIFKKKGYYSKDRESNIIFDVSIEISYPGQTDYALLILIECKNYGSSVKVDDVEEFYSKADQVASANSKAILVTTNSFQGGTRRFAKSKGIGLARYTDPYDLKWELYRSPSALASSVNNIFSSEIEETLSTENYSGRLFDLVFQSPIRATNSVWDFFEDILRELAADEDDLTPILNDRSKLDLLIPYITHSQIEDLSTRLVSGNNHVLGQTNLETLALQIPRLQIVRSEVKNTSVLASASFESNQITLFQDDEPHRLRFTLAHELSHFFLDHGRFMRQDTCEASDLAALKSSSSLPGEVRRMEYQANLLASCLLLPRHEFVKQFHKIAKDLDLQDRGFGYIYLDLQPCNMRSFMLATSELMRIFSVSRSVARIRLETLGFLTSAQAAQRAI